MAIRFDNIELNYIKNLQEETVITINANQSVLFQSDVTASSGNITAGAVGKASDTVMRVLAGDSNKAGFEAYGNSQGTGYLYVGQSSTYGGGISYNGDNSPSFISGESSDRITFFRRNAGTSSEVFSYSYISDSVYFNGDVTAATGFRTLSGQAIDFVNTNIGYNSIKRDTTNGGLVFNTGGTASLNIFDNGNATFAGDVTVDGGDLTITKQNDAPTMTLLHDGTNPSTNDLLFKMQFQSDYDGSHQNWGKIELSTNASAVRTEMDFYVKSTSGNEELGLRIEGGTTKPKTYIYGDLIVEGDTTTLNTQTVEVEDNILQLNTTQGSPDTATATTSGISIYRGNGVTQASFIFDDADDTWDLTNNLVVAGSATADTLTLTSGNDNLTFTQSGDDWTINNEQQNNGITIYDGTGGIDIKYAGTSYLDIDVNGVSVAGNIDFSVDTDTLYVDSTNENVGINSTGNTDYSLYVNGKIASNNYIIASLGNGGVALTHNDGYGNANVTFNHVSGIPEQNGNSFRIECNTDSSTNPAMIFELVAGVTSGVAVSTVEKMRLDETGVKVRATSGGILHLERNDTTIIDGNPLGRLRFTGDDPTDGTFNFGAEIRGEAAGTWSTDNYPTELQFYTATTDTLNLALKLDESQNATFNGTVTAATSFISDAIGTSNNDPGDGNAQFNGYGIIGHRGAFYITNAETDSGATVQIGIGGIHNAAPKLVVGTTNSTFYTNVQPQADSTYNLGTTSLRWANIYADNVDFGGDSQFERVGINMAPNSAYQLSTYYQQTNPDDDFRFAHYIDANFSGADNTTADREQGGIYLDLDSSADGDAADEHRYYGIYIDQRFSGFSDSVTGVYARVESNNNTEKTANIQAMHGIAIHDSGVSGGVASIHGGKFETYVEDDGDMDNSYGVFGRTLVNSTRAVNVDATYGGFFEVQTDSPNAITYGSMHAVRATIDNNEGAVPTFGNQYLYYGDYQGTKGSNAYGLYLTNEDKNYLSSNLGIGVPNPNNTLDIDSNFTNSVHIQGTGSYNLYSYHDSSGVGWATGAGTSYDNLIYLQASSDKIHFYTAQSNRMTIHSSGVGIGTTTPYQKLDVVGTIEAGDVSATNGALTLVQKYSGVNNDYIGSISTQYSSGAMILGYGARGKNGSGSASFTSTFDNFSAIRGALRLLNGELRLYSSVSAVQTTVGSDLTMTNTFVITSAGDVGIGATTPSEKLHVVGDQLIYGNLYLESTSGSFRQIAMNTADGADNQSLHLCGGGTASGVRGAQVIVKGNEVSSEGGSVQIQAGRVSTGDIIFKTGVTVGERMRIDEGGNIGIGTASPSCKLQVVDSISHVSGSISVSDAILDLFNDYESDVAEKGAILTFSDYYNDGAFNRTTRAAIKGGTDTAGNTAAGFLAFYTDAGAANSATERMRIDDAGNVGIGVTSPSGKLHVDGIITTDARSSRDKIRVWSSGTYAIGMKNNMSYGAINSDYAMTFQMSNTANRGFWWGDSSHTDTQGAMSLSTTGIATIATSLSIGEGQSETSPQTDTLFVSGSGKFQPAIADGDALVTIAQTNSNAYVHAGLKINAGNTNPFYIYQSGSSNTLRFNYNSLADAGGQMVITSGGNIGINEASPSQKLDVDGYIQAQDGIVFGNNVSSNTVNGPLIRQYGTYGIQNVIDTKLGGEWTIWHRWGNGGEQAEAVLVDGNGASARMGINKSSMSHNFEVGGTALIDGNTLIGGSGSGNIYVGGQTTGQYFRIHHNNSDTYLDANGGKIYFRGDSGANTRFEMDMTGTNAGKFIAAGDVVAFGSPSDKTLKENIRPIENALDKVNKLKGVEFNWKEQGITNLNEDIGFIAQDVQEVLPQLVRENENGKLSLRHQGIVPVLVEAIKELKQEIETLKTQINN